MTTDPATSPPGKAQPNESIGLGPDFFAKVERQVQEEAARKADRRRELRGYFC